MKNSWKNFFGLGLIAIATAFVAACQSPQRDVASEEAAVRSVLEEQVREWNAGNLTGFMETYAKSKRTRFASGGDIFLGWQTVFDRYRARYSDRAAMGTLRFSDLDITLFGPDSALAFGRWHLQREKDAPNGVFSLILRKLPEGWRIVHDHTSAAEKK